MELYLPSYRSHYTYRSEKSGIVIKNNTVKINNLLYLLKFIRINKNNKYSNLDNIKY